MSRATVRKAVRDWFDTPDIPLLGTVRASKPSPTWPATDFSYTDGQSIGAAYVYIERVQESRVTMPAVTGWKRLDYDVALVILFRSTLKDTDAATDDLDLLIEQVKSRLRKDLRLGQAPNVIWQAGVTLVEDISDETKYSNQVNETWCAVRFDVTEMIPA